MLEVLVKLLASLIMSITGLYVIKEITCKRIQSNKIKTLFLIAILTVITTILLKSRYTGLNTIIIFFINIIIYKNIFNMKLGQAIVSCGMLMLLMFMAECISAVLFLSFASSEVIRTNIFLLFITNIIVCIIILLLIKTSLIKQLFHRFYEIIKNKEKVTNIIFLILLTIAFSFFFYNIGISTFLNAEFILNYIIIIVLTIITFIFFESINKYQKLEREYDNLFSYIQTFEDWIEKEQLNRHEYKNQLAVIRCVTKDKKVKDKIDEILEDNINIDNQSLTNLKSLPKGGLKGLMYYKAAIAQKRKIKLSTDVYIDENGMLSKLSKDKIRTLCKLIGIYFDNAIEASMESRKRILVIEIYELKDSVSIVFSNTFKKETLLKDRNKKGISSKGEGRGNGLYFASKILKENSWIKEKQEIIDNYYVEKITIKNKKKNINKN